MYLSWFKYKEKYRFFNSQRKLEQKAHTIRFAWTRKKGEKTKVMLAIDLSRLEHICFV